MAKKKAEKPENKIESGESNEPGTKQASAEDFPVIGIGASAGGLEAFGKLLSSMPVDTGMAFVLIQHLDPTHASNMVEILRRFTKMQVHEATENIKLEPDHVYIIPPNRNMTITDRTLQLLQAVERPGIMHSIDLFFRSLANDLKDRAICIILSGTGSDGSMGARAVKAEMGMVMVQDPDSAAYDGMPRAAIAAGVADFVLPAERMAKQLVDFVAKSWGKRAVRRREVERDSASLATILTLVRARTKHDFSSYKQSTINRRIERRMGINQIDNISDYLKYLREHQTEVDALVKDFLINVTSFFRDPEAFLGLKVYLKRFLENKPEGAELRAWVPGCSTGEEAYSIAILMVETLDELHKYCQVQVFGTDLDHDAVITARTGIYPSSIAADVGESRLKRYFSRIDDQFQVKRELREKLVFAVQDVIADPPFTRMDLISSRNLLIYFDSDLQKKLIPMFHYALNRDGLLFLGTAETVGEFSELFVPVDRKWKIYRAEIRDKHVSYTLSHPAWQEPAEHKETDQYRIAHPSLPSRSLQEVLLEALPASVLLDSNFQIIYSHGNTRRYLGFPAGKPNTSILEIVHPELRSALSSALHDAVTQASEIIREGVRVKVNGNTQPARIVVKPVSPTYPGEPKGRIIVTFQDMPKMPASRRKGLNAADSRVTELEQELQFNKETLRSTIEELETANEELRSANEEYQSTNEELQSTNEELETSREELQSVNEELSTVNTEHQAKIEELSTVNDDMKNLLNSTGIATLYLDNELKVKRFTPTATGIFNLIASDVERPIGHITSQIANHDIETEARKVLDTLVPVKDSVQSRDGKWYSMRILPYRTTDNAIAGVVVSFVDISEQERARLALSLAKDVVDTLFQPVAILDNKLNVISANHAFYDNFKITRDKVEQKPLFEIDDCAWRSPEFKKKLEEVAQNNSELVDYIAECDFQSKGRRRLRISARPLQNRNNLIRILMTAEEAE